MAEKRKFNINKRYILAALGVFTALVITVGLGALARLLQTEYQKSNPDTRQTDQVAPREGTEIQNLQSQGKTEEADKKIKEVLDNPSSSDDAKYITYIQQGNGYVNSGNVQAGLDAYLKAHAIRETYEIVLLVADTYAQLGNKTQAVEFYRKALNLIPESPIMGDEKGAIEQKIRDQGDQV